MRASYQMVVWGKGPVSVVASGTRSVSERDGREKAVAMAMGGRVCIM